MVFAFEGRARLFHELAVGGVSVRRIALEREKLSGNGAKAYLEGLLAGQEAEGPGSDAIQEIEGGFLFRFPQLSYRVIGNFSDYELSMKANLKAFTDQEVFVDSIDLYKNRDRQNLIYNLMDRFGIRDQIQLEKDLHQIIEVIERHREKKKIYREMVTRLMTDPQAIDQAMRLTWVAHNLERVADRVGNICERVVFSLTGSFEEMTDDSGPRRPSP